MSEHILALTVVVGLLCFTQQHKRVVQQWHVLSISSLCDKYVEPFNILSKMRDGFLWCRVPEDKKNTKCLILDCLCYVSQTSWKKQNSSVVFKEFVVLACRKKHDSSLLRLYKVLVQQERSITISFLAVINGLVVIRTLIRKEAEVCPFFIKWYKRRLHTSKCRKDRN